MSVRQFFALAALCGILVLSAWYQPNIRDSQDTKIYLRIGSDVQKLHMGETDKLKSEYPPAATAVFYFVQENIFNAPFHIAWTWFLLLVTTFASLYSSKYFHKKEILTVPIAVLSACLFLGLELVFARYDVLIMIFMLLAWRAQSHKRYKDSGLFLTLAGTLKIVPLFALPLLWITTPKKHRKPLLKGMITGALISTVFAVLALGPSGFAQNIQHMANYHEGRGAQLESTVSSIDMIGRRAKVEYRAMSAINANVSEDIAFAAKVIIVLGILFLWRVSRKKYSGKYEMFGPLLFILFIWMMSLSPVLSPQYFVWIMPLILVWLLDQFDEQSFDNKILMWIGCAILFVQLGTQWIFPYHYGFLLDQSSYSAVLFLNARNIVFIIIGIALWRLHFQQQHKWIQKIRSYIPERPKKKRKRMTRLHHTIFISGIMLLAASYLQYEPQIQKVQYTFDNNEPTVYDYAPMVETKGERLEVEMLMKLSGVRPFAFRVKPDDCIESFTINNKKVDPKVGHFCDYGNGRDLDLSRYMRTGVNHISLVLKDTGGLAGLHITPAKSDPILWLFYITLFVLLTWYARALIHDYTRGKWPSQLWTIFVGGSLLRIFYFIGTNPHTRGHDVGGHLDYIKYIAENMTLPESQAGWEYHQAPLYYYLSALWINMGSMLERTYDLLLRDIQRIALFFSLIALAGCAYTASIIFSHKRDHKKAIIFMLMISFIPAVVYVSSRVTNNTMYTSFAMLCVLGTALWWEYGTKRIWYSLCTLIAVTSLIKISAYAFIPVAFLCLLLRKGDSLRTKISQGLIGGIIVLLIAGSFPLYRLVAESDHSRSVQLGNQGMHGGLRLPVTHISDLVTFNPARVLSIPFNNPWINESGRQYFWEYFFRSAFFGEFSFDTWRMPFGSILLLLSILLIPVLLLGIWKRIRHHWYASAPMAFSLLFLVASSLSYRILFPYGSNSDFRFVIPIIIPISYFLVYGFDYLPRPLQKPAQNVAVIVCILSAIFVSSLYWA